MTGTATNTELEHRIGPEGRFALRLPSGSVSIRAVDGDVAKVRDLEGRSLSERFEISTGPDFLELVNRNKLGVTFQIGSFGIGGGSAEIAVELPRAARIALDLASADVSVVGIRGPGRYRTASGDLILQDVGGNLEIEGVSGDVRIEAVSAIELVGRTISGDAVIRAPRLTRFEFSTTSGDIRVDAELNGKGPFSVKSISGDVTLVGRGTIEVEAQTVTGDLHSDLAHRSSSGPGRRTMLVGTSSGKAAASVTFKSVSGDLTVVEPRDAAPPMPPAAPRAPAPPVPPMPAFAADTSDQSAPATEHAPELDASPEAENVRLEILRALERGEIDVETATRRLAAAEEA